MSVSKSEFVQKGLTLIDRGLNSFDKSGLYANSTTKLEEHRKALRLIHEGNSILKTILKGIN